MKTAISILASALALAACGGGDHESDEGVVWRTTSAPTGTRASIDDDALVLEKVGPGPEFWPLPQEASLQVATDLPAGDFQARFTGLSVPDGAGGIGVYVATDEYSWARAEFIRDADDWSEIVVWGTSEAMSWVLSPPAPGDVELVLVREGDEVVLRTRGGGEEVTLTEAIGAGPAVVTVYLEALPDVAPGATTRGRIEGRALPGEMGSFAGDLIE